MSLFSGYHLIGSGLEPAEPTPAPRPTADIAATHPGTVIPVRAQGGDEQWKLLRSQLESTLAEQSLQLDAERANGRRTRTALYALAGHLCKGELEKKRRQLGDRKLWDWSAEDWCSFITEHAASPSEPRTPSASIETSAAYARLQLEFAELRIEHVKRLEELAHLKQALEAARKPAESSGPSLAPAEPASASSIPAVPLDPGMTTDLSDDSNQARINDLIRLIASTGLARMARLREHLTQSWGLDPRSGSFRGIVDAALKAGLIVEQTVQADWRGASKSSVVSLSREGRTRAVTILNTSLVAGELEPGQTRGYAVELSVLILKAADVLREAGYRHVQAFPTEVVLAYGRPYYPPISAVEATGEVVFIECERGLTTEDRSEHWLRAVEAGGGELRLITTTAQAQESLVSDINTVKMRRPFRLLAGNISDIDQGKRGRDGSIWTYQNSPRCER